MSYKESSINYKKVISSICICKNYELFGGLDIIEKCLFNLHTKNAIYTYFGLTNTEEYHVCHNRIRRKYSEEDTQIKKKLLEELGINELKSNFHVFEKNLKDVNDTSFQRIVKCLPEEYKNKEKQNYKELIKNKKSKIEDKSFILIKYTNGDFVRISLEYLNDEFIKKFSDIINNGQEKYKDALEDEIVRAPLLRFENKHDIEIEYLKKFLHAYYDLNFKNIYDLLYDNCFKISTSNKDKYNTIIGKNEIIENYENLIRIAKRNNLIYQGSIFGELTNENESILKINFTGRERNNYNDQKRERKFLLSIRINDENLIYEINIADAEGCKGKHLSREDIDKIKKGEYSDFNTDFKVNERIFTDKEIEFLLNFYDKYFEGNISLQDAESKLKELYKDFTFSSGDIKNRLIGDIISTSGSVKYNLSNLICSDCGCKYISSLGFGYLRKKKKEDNKHDLYRHAYGCIITGNEYSYQCLGCGKEW